MLSEINQSHTLFLQLLLCNCSVANCAIEILEPVRLNVKGLYSAHHGRRSSSEDEEDDKVDAEPTGKGFGSNPPRMIVLGRSSVVSKNDNYAFFARFFVL